MSKSFAALPWPEQVLWALAVMTYLALGVFLGLFSNGFDFIGVYAAAAQIAHGHGADIYQRFLTLDPAGNPMQFSYAAPVALLYAPLGRLPLRWAWPLFQILSHGCLWAAAWLGIREARDRNIPDPELRIIIGMALFFPIYYSLWLGQCETLVLFLLIAALRLYRHESWALMGAALAVAMCLKIFLGLILVYVLLTRRWRLLGACASGLLALEAASLGVTPAKAQLAYWHFAPTWTARILAFYDNQAVGGFFARLLTVNVYTDGVIHRPGAAVLLQWVATSGIVIAYVRNLRRVAARDFGCGMAYTVITALLISPLTDTHHLTFLLIPFLFFGFAERSPAGWRWFYAFFAVYIPTIAFKFVADNRLLYFATGFHTLMFSLPFLVLMAFWLYFPASNEG